MLFSHFFTDNLDNVDPRREKIARVSYEVLESLLSLDGTRRVKIVGLPKDARLVRTLSDCYALYGQLGLVFRSQEFPTVQEGCVIPELVLIAQSVNISFPGE